jgi:hypothetical protein
MRDKAFYNSFYNKILLFYPNMLLGEVYKHKLKDLEIDVLECLNVPVKGYSTFVTNGLRKFSNLQEKSNIMIKQELIFSQKECISSKEINLIFSIFLSKILVANQKPYKRGELISHNGYIWENYTFDSFVCYEPLYLDDNYINDNNLDKTILVQVYPLYKDEREFINKNGHISFFDLVYEQDPDLMDLKRLPLNLRAKP